MKRLLITFAILFCSFSCYAGDFAHFKQLGFSESGQYYAFMQMGTHDGSGLPYAEVFVIDVKKNEIVASGSYEAPTSEGAETETDVSIDQACKKAIEATNLGKFAIVADQFPGDDLLVRLPTDHSKFSDIVFATDNFAEGGATGQATRYTVKVETTATKPADKSIPEDFGTAQLLKLSVSWTEDEKARNLVIQDDKKLPLNRAYPLGYTVRRITGYNGGIVVIVSYETPGFEGPNVRYMVFGSEFAIAMG